MCKDKCSTSQCVGGALNPRRFFDTLISSLGRLYSLLHVAALFSGMLRK